MSWGCQHQSVRPSCDCSWRSAASRSSQRFKIHSSATRAYIYRDRKDRGGLLTKIATLKLPANSPHPFMRSMEPLVSLRGGGGASYFPVLAAPTSKTYARTAPSIWVLGLGTDPQRRIVRRVDDGGVTGVKDYRYEPETSSGRGEILVYYTVNKEAAWRPVVHGLRRSRTAPLPAATGISSVR